MESTTSATAGGMKAARMEAETAEADAVDGVESGKSATEAADEGKQAADDDGCRCPIRSYCRSGRRLVAAADAP